MLSLFYRLLSLMVRLLFFLFSVEDHIMTERRADFAVHRGAKIALAKSAR
jgi:hypothetical protein